MKTNDHFFSLPLPLWKHRDIPQMDVIGVSSVSFPAPCTCRGGGYGSFFFLPGRVATSASQAANEASALDFRLFTGGFFKDFFLSRKFGKLGPDF